MKNHQTKKDDEIHIIDFRNIEMSADSGDWENTKSMGQ